jgi:hypothetical protein
VAAKVKGRTTPGNGQARTRLARAAVVGAARILFLERGYGATTAALLDELTRQRQRGQSLVARSLARAGALRPTLRERDAADIIHALMSPELYRLLVVDRGWRPDRHQQWLAGIVIDQLLAETS